MWQVWLVGNKYKNCLSSSSRHNYLQPATILKRSLISLGTQHVSVATWGCLASLSSAVLIWEQWRCGHDRSWPVSQPGNAGALWTLWSSTGWLTCRIRACRHVRVEDPGLFWLALVQQWLVKFSKSKNSPPWHQKVNAFLPPTLFINVEAHAEYRYAERQP